MLILSCLDDLFLLFDVGQEALWEKFII